MRNIQFRLSVGLTSFTSSWKLICPQKYIRSLLTMLIVVSPFSSTNMCVVKIWASSRENMSSGFAIDTGTDQPASPRSLISAFVIRFLESTICKFATCEMSVH